MTRNSFLNLKRELRQSNNCLNTLFYLPFPCSISRIILHGWCFPRHTSKLPWPNSPGHCLTSSICPGTHPLQPKVRHIHLAQQDVDRPATCEGCRGAIEKGSRQFLCVCLWTGIHKTRVSHRWPHASQKISSIRQSFWGGLLKCSFLSRDWWQLFMWAFHVTSQVSVA